MEVQRNTDEDTLSVYLALTSFLSTKVVARGMVDRGKGGSIVMMSSVFGLVASETRSVYCCTKAALDQLTRCLAVELGPHKARNEFGVDIQNFSY